MNLKLGIYLGTFSSYLLKFFQVYNSIKGFIQMDKPFIIKNFESKNYK